MVLSDDMTPFEVLDYLGDCEALHCRPHNPYLMRIKLEDVFGYSRRQAQAIHRDWIIKRIDEALAEETKTMNTHEVASDYYSMLFHYGPEDKATRGYYAKALRDRGVIPFVVGQVYKSDKGQTVKVTEIKKRPHYKGCVTEDWYIYFRLTYPDGTGLNMFQDWLGMGKDTQGWTLVEEEN